MSINIPAAVFTLVISVVAVAPAKADIITVDLYDNDVQFQGFTAAGFNPLNGRFLANSIEYDANNISQGTIGAYSFPGVTSDLAYDKATGQIWRLGAGMQDTTGLRNIPLGSNDTDAFAAYDNTGFARSGNNYVIADMISGDTTAFALPGIAQNLTGADIATDFINGTDDLLLYVTGLGAVPTAAYDWNAVQDGTVDWLNPLHVISNNASAGLTDIFVDPANQNFYAVDLDGAYRGNIVPAPGSAALAGLGGLIAARRRRAV